MSLIQVGLLGGTGRMGGWVTRLVREDFKDRSELLHSCSQGEAIEPLLSCQVVIDFSSPEAMLKAATLALKTKGKAPAFVIGSTGWAPEGRAKLEELSRITPVLMSSNFSTGVLILSRLLKQAGPWLKELGFTPVMVEAHHRHKKDAPSGTALLLQKAMGEATLQTHSIRAGEVIGDHEVTFYGHGETVRLSHSAADRSIFARGAIEAALWLSGQSAQGRILDMNDFFDDFFREKMK